jgi:ribosome-binding protein aMBF1 (putative translation factor)
MFRKKRARPSAGDHNGMRLHPSSVRRGTLCREAKLNEEKVYEIKELCHAGLTRAELARRFQVSETLIRLIDQGKAWAHIYWP